MNDGHFSCDFESGSSGDCDRSIPLLFNLRGTRVIKSRSLSILSQLTLSRFHPYFSFVAVFTNEDLISTHSCRLFFYCLFVSSFNSLQCALFCSVFSVAKEKCAFFSLSCFQFPCHSRHIVDFTSSSSVFHLIPQFTDLAHIYLYIHI